VAAGLGGTPARETILVAADTTDFTTAIEEVLASDADFVYVTWAGASGVTLFTQLGELGVKEAMPVVTGFNSNSIQSQLPINQPGDVGLIVYHYTLPDTEVNDWLVERHIEEFGTPPDLFSECGFATAQALVAALEATEGSTLPEDLIPALEGLEFEGPKGTYTIRAEDHQALMPMYFIELTEPAPAEDTPFAYYTLLQEISPEEAAPPCLAAGRSSETLVCPEAAE
jgi:branched-chain amino acid transport system substrate-binding protein